VILLPKLLPDHSTPDTSTTNDAASLPSETADLQETDQTEEPSKDSPQINPLSYAVAEAVYPEECDDLTVWNRTKEDTMQYQRADGKTDSLQYTRAVLKSFLSGTEENAAFSPLSLYFSLASLAEISDGDTRAQILDLLGAPDIESLRKTAHAVWLNVYVKGKPYGDCSSGDKECVIPSNSFWLNSNAAVTGDTSVAEILKNDYFTSFFKGDPLDDGFQSAYRAWMNDHTGGLLKDVVENMSFSPTDIFTMINTLYLKVTWMEPFHEEENTVEPFYGINGNTEATYMHNTTCYGGYYKGSCFSFGYLPTNVTAGVAFILPDPGTTLEELIQNEAYMEYFENRWDESNSEPPEGYDMYEITFSVPKFSITSSYDLKPYLTSLGISDAFDADKADITFVKSNDGGNIFITKANQDVTVDVNEKGISAASITTMGGGWGDPVFYKVDMNLNRPFLMIVLSECNTPLFAAVVNNIE
jgi:serine protease inhibitor